MAPLFLLFPFFIGDSLYTHSLRSFSSTVKLQVTTGFISVQGEVARIAVWMLLLGEEEGGMFCLDLGGLFTGFRGNGLAPTLFFQMYEVDLCVLLVFFVFVVFVFLFLFSLLLVCYMLNSQPLDGPG